MGREMDNFRVVIELSLALIVFACVFCKAANTHEEKVMLLCPLVL